MAAELICTTHSRFDPIGLLGSELGFTLIDLRVNSIRLVHGVVRSFFRIDGRMNHRARPKDVFLAREMDGPVKL